MGTDVIIIVVYNDARLCIYPVVDIGTFCCGPALDSAVIKL